MTIDYQDLLSKCDHTILKPETTWNDVQKVCDDAILFQCASICIPPCFVKKAVEYVDGQIPVCTVVGFPNGYQYMALKEKEAAEALRDGASELDVVINIGKVKEGNYRYVTTELQNIKKICSMWERYFGSITLKVIIETCLLTEEEKIKLCEIVTNVGADFIKTSTGFSTSGATVEDVRLLREHVGPRVRVKASGGISSFKEAQALVDAGAERLGTSRLVKLAKEKKK